ncbi:MAG: hypothetical protein H0U66_13455 [Gemmatimonadaceae bacterium]|nr:hypothetical protein [Gemmatimonadaceae bacterium]
MKASSSLSLILVACMLSACSDSITSPSPTPRTITVSATGSFGPSGTVSILNVSGANSTLTGNLIGFDASTDHSVAIVLGSCASPGTTSMTLANIAASSSGQATIPSTSVPDAIVTAGYAIVFYATASSTSAIIACGDLS